MKGKVYIHNEELIPLYRHRRYSHNLGRVIVYRKSYKDKKIKKQIKYFLRSLLGKKTISDKDVELLYSGLNRNLSHITIGFKRCWEVDGNVAFDLLIRDERFYK